MSFTLQACEISVVVQQFEHSLALSFFGIEMKTDHFQSCGTAEFSKFAGILSAALSQHHLSGFEVAQLKFHHSTSFVHSDGSKLGKEYIKSVYCHTAYSIYMQTTS